jgi:hypothetical protein
LFFSIYPLSSILSILIFEKETADRVSYNTFHQERILYADLACRIDDLDCSFAPLCSKPVFEEATLLLVGAILAFGKRTVTACLRVCGKANDPHLQNYHRLLNRARWAVVFVADSSFAVIELLNKVSHLQGASLMTRLRLAAALYDPAPERKPGQMRRPHLQGGRRPTLKKVLNERRRKWTNCKSITGMVEEHARLKSASTRPSGITRGCHQWRYAGY